MNKFPIDKQALIQQVIRQVQQELDTLLHASDEAHKTATHSESKAENKYDTRGLEAAYLAHGLSMRVQALRQAVAELRAWSPRSYGTQDLIGLGALVTLEREDGTRRRVLLAPQGGGVRVADDNGEVTVVSPTAPLGEALLGRSLDEELTLTLGGVRADYAIVELA